MNQKRAVKYIIGFLITVCALLGLNCNMYSFRTKKFYIDTCLVIWCLISMFIFAWLYLKKLYDGFINDEFVIENAVSLFYYMNVIGGLLNYCSQILVGKGFTNLFNNSNVFEAMDYLSVDLKMLQSQIVLVVTKIILYPLVTEITLILQHLREDEDDTNVLWTLFTLYPLILSNVIPNCFFGIMILSRQGILALNQDLLNVEKEANFIQNPQQMGLHKHYYRMHRFCNLADKLDELLRMYSMICYSTMNYVNLSAIPIIAALLCNLFAITAGFFRQYYSLADTLINEESYDAFNAITNAVFLIISLIEVALHSFVAEQIVQAVRKKVISRFISLKNI